ncbi:hypothetical protein BDY19DRAFT_993532 [Irpex rosettiformis]|uniref:Uncharacterized protein n=1 Tax=Irpex rosettiformis TaxID=378272 RepID=A0ACB8U5S5_9APHY|nr:hypothetical protein BDY19DRAFT_993532 [Irpex rosettiformis]
MASSPALIIYGPIFMGMIFNVLLYGIMITQTYLYFTTYKHDKRWMKVFIAALFICDTVNTGFDIALVWNPLVARYGDLNALAFADWLSSADPATTGFIALLTQLFFAWRVKVLSNNWFLVIAIAACSIGQFLGGIGTAIAVKLVPAFADFQKFESIVAVWLACSAAADTLITGSLVWHLRKHKSGFSVSDDTVDRIIRLTVQTGMVTAVCAITDLIVFLSVPTGLHLAFNLPLAKLYTNSLMSTLNARSGWGFSRGASRSVDPPYSSNGRVGAASVRVLQSNMIGNLSHTQNQQVFVDVETIEMRDVDGKEENLNTDPSSDSVHKGGYKRSFVDIA